MAQALHESFGVEARYLGVLNCAYRIGKIKLEKDSSMTVPDDEAEHVVRALGELKGSLFHSRSNKSGHSPFGLF